MKTYSIQCREIRYGEFPDLKFGKWPDQEIWYFNATEYIRRQGNPEKHTIRNFQFEFQNWINNATTAYTMTPQGFFIQDKSGNILIDECLALLFLMYVHPAFGIYLMERMNELLLTGITASDSWVLMKAKERFHPDDIISNLEKV